LVGAGAGACSCSSSQDIGVCDQTGLPVYDPAKSQEASTCMMFQCMRVNASRPKIFSAFRICKPEMNLTQTRHEKRGKRGRRP
jgi:hypothetical protein